MTNFTDVAEMNLAFNNPQGDPNNINWERIQKQCLNVFDEFIELQEALGADEETLDSLRAVRGDMNYTVYDTANLVHVRDALCDIHVYAYGAHHLMGVDADRDMKSVFASNMSKFIANDEVKCATIEKYAAKGVTHVYFQGDYPKMVMKSGSMQLDAPTDKFLKASTFQGPVFYKP